MSNNKHKVEIARNMIIYGDYFVINRPRQFGKTTLLYLLRNDLNDTEDFIVFNTSFEGIGDLVFTSEIHFCPAFLRLLLHKMPTHLEEATLSDFLKTEAEKVTSFELLSNAITKLCSLTKRKIVVFIDEVDKSSNNQLFLSFLGVLRTKYLERNSAINSTFHSVVLSGLHDVKNLKLKLDSGSEIKFNSPWNIAADFALDMTLQADEIAQMLAEYKEDRQVQMDVEEITATLLYYTSGYPFLVSKLCKMFDEKLLPTKAEKTWLPSDTADLVQDLVRQNNVNFDGVIARLENDAELYKLVFRLIMDAEQIGYNQHNAVFQRGLMYGILREANNLAVHNLIYQEIIGNYMASNVLVDNPPSGFIQFGGSYTLADNSLDMERVLSVFQAFMQEQYSKKDHSFLERHGRLVFLAFLKPILNGSGFTFKEVQISEERRLDVVITFNQFRYVAELKMWRGKAAHQKGLEQLANYLERQHLTAGFLIIFSDKIEKTWEKEVVEIESKKITAIWV